MSTRNFTLPELAAAQAQKHLTVNEALAMADALLTGLVVSATTAAAPLSPVSGDLYILPAGPSGFGSGVEGQLAMWIDGAWLPITPSAGWRFTAADTAVEYMYAAGAWREGVARGVSYGSSVGFRLFEVELDLAGSSVTASGLIPARAIVLGVTGWVTDAITGATGWRVGDGSTDDRFGSGLGLAVASSNVGVVGPFATYAATDLVVSAEGPNFTDGTVRLSAAVILPAAAPV